MKTKPDVEFREPKRRGQKPGIKASTAVLVAQQVVQDHAVEIKSLLPDIPDEIARLSPLEVMLKAMSIAAYEGKWFTAAALAKEAAPYVHPKLAAIDVSTNNRRNIDEFTDAELIALAGEISDAEGSDQTTEGEGSSSRLH